MLTFSPQVANAMVEILNHSDTRPGVKAYVARTLTEAKETGFLTDRQASKVGSIHYAVVSKTQNSWWIKK